MIRMGILWNAFFIILTGLTLLHVISYKVCDNLSIAVQTMLVTNKLLLFLI